MRLSEITEKRRNPEQNRRAGSGKYDLINWAEDNITDRENWAVSMTNVPKLGVNPRPAVSEDTPKGIYFYPLQYFMKMADRDEELPWGDNMPYMQLFQYDRSGEMTRETKVDPAKLKQAILDLPYNTKIDDNGIDCDMVFIPESDYGFAEIYRMYDDILVFLIPTLPSPSIVTSALELEGAPCPIMNFPAPADQAASVASIKNSAPLV